MEWLRRKHTKREKDQKAHLHYYATAYNRWRQLFIYYENRTLQYKTKSNMTKKHASLTKKYI